MITGRSFSHREEVLVYSKTRNKAVSHWLSFFPKYLPSSLPGGSLPRRRISFDRGAARQFSIRTHCATCRPPCQPCRSRAQTGVDNCLAFIVIRLGGCSVRLITMVCAASGEGERAGHTTTHHSHYCKPIASRPVQPSSPQDPLLFVQLSRYLRLLSPDLSLSLLL
jgi:hypothetical protein